MMVDLYFLDIFFILGQSVDTNILSTSFDLYAAISGYSHKCFLFIFKRFLFLKPLLPALHH